MWRCCPVVFWTFLLTEVAVASVLPTTLVAQEEGGCRYSSRTADAVVRAVAFRVAGYPHRAISELTRAIAEDSTCGQLWALLARSYWEAGDIEQSIAAAQKALSADSSIVEAYQLLAEALAVRDPISASRYAVAAWQKEPTLSNQLRAAYLLRYSDTTQAIGLLRSVFDRTNANEIAEDLVRLCLDHRDTTQAISLLRLLLFEYPDEPGISRALGFLYAQRSQWDSAWYCVRYACYHMESLDVASLLSEWLSLVGHDCPTSVLLQTGLFIRGRHDLPADYSLMIAMLLAERSLWSEAFVHIESAFARRDLTRHQALTAIELVAQYDDARHADELLCRRDTMFSDTWVPVARYYLARSYGTLQSSAHMNLLADALRRDSTDPIALFYSAYYADSLGDRKKAIELYERLVFFDPDNATAANNLAYLLAEQGERLIYALELAQRALDADSTNPSFLDTYGWVLHKLGRYREAVAYFERALALSQSHSATLFEHMGDNYDRLGDHDRACQYWRRAVEVDPRRTYLLDRLR